MSAVTQVPIFCPTMIGIAAPYVIAPVVVSDWRIPTDAPELDYRRYDKSDEQTEQGI